MNNIDNLGKVLLGNFGTWHSCGYHLTHTVVGKANPLIATALTSVTDNVPRHTVNTAQEWPEIPDKELKASKNKSYPWSHHFGLDLALTCRGRETGPLGFGQIPVVTLVAKSGLHALDLFQDFLQMLDWAGHTHTPCTLF